MLGPLCLHPLLCAISGAFTRARGSPLHPYYYCVVSKLGIPSWTTESPNCDLQHRRRWLAALILSKRLRSTMVLIGSRIWSAGHEDNRISIDCPVGSSRHCFCFGGPG